MHACYDCPFIFTLFRNAFVQFVKENYHREIETGNNLKEQMKELKCIWKSMSPNKQEVYNL